MANFFLTDSDGNKQGPLTTKQLQALINRGTITPTTPLETEDGHQGLAGQIPGLQFNNVAPAPFAQSAPQTPKQTTNSSPPRQPATYSQQNESAGRPWLTDFTFQDIQLPENGRRICSYIYCCCVAMLIINGLLGFFLLNPMYDAEAMTVAVIFLVCYLFFVYIFLALMRVACELLIVLLDYMSRNKER
jgi:hypothetical protein